jgi:predicted dehydrogenase
MDEAVLLVGAGPMAAQYAKVLQKLGRPFSVVGRGVDSARSFASETAVEPATGGIEQWLASHASWGGSTAIVAVSEAQIGVVARELIRAGFKRLLLEKPGGSDYSDIRGLCDEATRHAVRVSVGYNRRQYASVLEARRIIQEDGGAESFFFDFTEWSHVIEPLSKEGGVKEHWFLHNSSHVVDLAFHLGGKPREIVAFRDGQLTWHRSGAVFSGAGVSELGAVFSYHANWNGPGRWGVEVVTRKRKLFLRPLEKLHVQQSGTVFLETAALDDELDLSYKPGIFRQTQLFLDHQYDALCSLEEQVGNLEHYRKICDESGE